MNDRGHHIRVVEQSNRECIRHNRILREDDNDNDCPLDDDELYCTQSSWQRW